MLRVVALLLGCFAAAWGLSWLADRPGNLVINWQGYVIETSVFRAVVMLTFLIGLAILGWSVVTMLWRSPASVGAFFNRRRQMRGLEALSGGMIAIGAGDRAGATHFAVQARRALPNEPLTHLLRAQAAQLSGDRATARRMFEAMLAQPETEQLGLRGLFLEAEREGEYEPARQFAQRSVELNPKLQWAVDSLFDLQCKERDWAGALETLSIAKKHHHYDKAKIDRRRAVLMTARAQALEETDPGRAMSLAIEAHYLAHDLIPAATIAGRMLAARGHTKRAAKIIERAWRRGPHPDLALVYAHVRIGDSPSDRLERVKRLAQLNPHSIETPIAIATAAVEAKDWATARRMLEPLDASRVTQRVCTLMARIEGEEKGDKGRVREWLARAVHAPRDPAWVADGAVADKWAPVSPVTGAFDVFQWRVPADALDVADAQVLAAKLDELVRLGASASESAQVSVDRDEARQEPVVDMPGSDRDATKLAARRAQGGSAVPSREATDVQTVAPAAEPGVDRSAPATGAGRSKLQPSSETRGAEVMSGAGFAGRKDAATVEAPRPVANGAAVAGDTTPIAAGPKTIIAGGAALPADNAKTRASMVEKKPLDPSMFIAPRAPDDPGVVVEDAEERKPRAVASVQR